MTRGSLGLDVDPGLVAYLPYWGLAPSLVTVVARGPETVSCSAEPPSSSSVRGGRLSRAGGPCLASAAGTDVERGLNLSDRLGSLGGGP